MLSLCGVLVAALPCGIIGIILSALGMKDTSNPVVKGKGLAIAGLVVGIIDVIFGFISIAMAVTLTSMFTL